MQHYFNPVHIYQGDDCLNHVNECIRCIEKPIKQILLITYHKDVLDDPLGETIIKQLADYTVYTKIYEKSNPDITDLYQMYQQTKGLSIDLVICVGGGSILDIGKSLSRLYGNDIADIDDVINIIENKEKTNIHTQWIGIPTTAGTGSEVTCWATIWDKSNNKKLSFERQDHYAHAAFIQPQFLYGVPKQLLVSSALDAMAHAVEAYWAKKTNDISQMYALEAISLVMNNLFHAIKDPKAYAPPLAKASLLAGLAFSNTKTTACHSISYPLTLAYSIPHGVAVSLLLAPVLNRNHKSFSKETPLLDALGIHSAKTLNDRITELLSMVEIPHTLSQWGVKKEDLDQLAALGSTKGRMDNNPVDFDQQEIKELLEEIYD